MINYLLLVLLILAILILLYIAYQLTFKQAQVTDEKSDVMLSQLSERIKETNERIDRSSSDSRNLSMDTNRTLLDVREKLTKLDATNTQVVNFATQLQSLENILKNPKQRGILGEYFLEALLGNILQPKQYQMQYKFPNGEIVDAVVFIKDQIVPIDAKFSLEKFNLIQEAKDKEVREKLEKEFKIDIKNRIDETAKYIRPEENTTDFAFMFIPAEGVFYSLLMYKVGSAEISSKDLIEYAFSKKVIIVSPTSFFAYLQTVLQALKSLKVEESVKDIIKHVQKLDRHVKTYNDIYEGLGKNLSATVNKYNTGYQEIKKIDKDVANITSGESTIEPKQIDKPQI